MGRRIGRPKVGQEPLTRERILAAALRLVDKTGVEGMSMRRLAADLGVDPMALYHHLPGKQAIIEGLVELVFNELRTPAVDGWPWPEQVRAFARAFRSLARAHPNLIFYLVTHTEAGADAVLAANESLYSALAAAGLAPRLIVRAADLVVDYLIGFALAESSGRLGQPGERQAMLAQLSQYPTEHYPTMRRVFDSLTEDEILADFEAELDIILTGIAAIAGVAEESSYRQNSPS
jgi:AcrR family transcriptional regulator